MADGCERQAGEVGTATELGGSVAILDENALADVIDSSHLVLNVSSVGKGPETDISVEESAKQF